MRHMLYKAKSCDLFDIHVKFIMHSCHILEKLFRSGKVTAYYNHMQGLRCFIFVDVANSHAMLQNICGAHRDLLITRAFRCNGMGNT